MADTGQADNQSEAGVADEPTQVDSGSWGHGCKGPFAVRAQSGFQGPVTYPPSIPAKTPLVDAFLVH